MNEKQLTRISIIGSVITLIAIYIFVSGISSVHVKIGDISDDYSGKIVNVTGKIQNLNFKDGNAFFTLVDETGEIRVVLWKDVLTRLGTRGTVSNKLKENVQVNIIGEVDVYRGYLQIVPTSTRISIID